MLQHVVGSFWGSFWGFLDEIGATIPSFSVVFGDS